MDSGTRVISFWTRILGIVGGYPETKTIPRTRPINKRRLPLTLQDEGGKEDEGEDGGRT